MPLTYEVGWLSTSAPTLWTLEDPTYGEIDSTYVIDGFGVELGVTWADVSDDVIGFTSTRGRENDIDETPVGECTLVLRNDSRDYDPFNTASPNYPGVRRGRPFRIHDGTETGWVFTGIIDDPDVTFTDQDWSECHLRGIDLLAKLAADTFDTYTPAAELSGARIGAVLDLAEVAWNQPRSIDTGWVNCGTVSPTTDANVLNYLQSVARAELGRLFIAGDGTFRFIGYEALVAATPKATFDNTGTAGLWFTEVRVRTPSEQQYGKIKATADGSSNTQTVTGTDADSWFTRTLTLDALPVADDPEADMVARTYLNRYEATEIRVAGITVDINSVPAANLATVVGLDLGDTIRVKFTPPGTGTPSTIDQYCIIERIAHQNDGRDHTMTLSLSKSPQWQFWTLEDPVLGVIDSTNVLSF